MARLIDLVESVTPADDRRIGARMDVVSKVRIVMADRGCDIDMLSDETGKDKEYLGRVLSGEIDMTVSDLSDFEYVLGIDLIDISL